MPKTVNLQIAPANLAAAASACAGASGWTLRHLSSGATIACADIDQLGNLSAVATATLATLTPLAGGSLDPGIVNPFVSGP